MKKYNRDRRGAYNAQTRHIHINDECGDAYNHATRIRVHIKPRYDGYKQTIYTRDIWRTRDTRTQQYINMLNTINDIFPDINAPHNRHLYRGTAPYRKFIPPRTDISPPETQTTPVPTTDTKRVKCIIYDRHDNIIYMGIFRRTREIDTLNQRVHTYLHRGDRQIEVKFYVPDGQQIYGMPTSEIYAHGVEIYHI